MDEHPTYCTLTPNLGTGTSAAIAGFDELTAFVDSLANEHAEYVAQHRHEWGDPFEKMEVGFSFFLKHVNGGIALIGVCSKGWVIYQMEPKPIKRIMGNSDREGTVAILLPEWSEFQARELISAERGKAILERWLSGLSPDIYE